MWDEGDEALIESINVKREGRQSIGVAEREREGGRESEREGERERGRKGRCVLWIPKALIIIRAFNSQRHTAQLKLDRNKCVCVCVCVHMWVKSRLSTLGVFSTRDLGAHPRWCKRLQDRPLIVPFSLFCLHCVEETTDLQVSSIMMSIPSTASTPTLDRQTRHFLDNVRVTSNS